MVKIVTITHEPDTPLTSPDEISWVYNGLDCIATTEVFETLEPQLTPVTAKTYALSRDLQGPILEMSSGGIAVNINRRDIEVSRLTTLRDRLEARLERLMTEGYQWPGFNPNSPKQLAAFLYDYLRLPIKRKRNANGRMSPTTDRNALESLATNFIAAPAINHILAIRDVTKKLQFLKKPLSEDNRLRTSLNIAGTNSGRLSSSSDDFGLGDNLQNVERGVRRTYIPSQGMKFCNIDLEQADSRNVGATCWNKFVESHGETYAGAYLDACESGDLHTYVTRLGWPHLPWGDDPSTYRALADTTAYRDYSYRDLAKRLGHGTNYYGKPFTMAAHAKIPVKIAEEFQDQYFSAFPCIREGHFETIRLLQSTARITTIMGRQRYFFSRLDDDRTIRTAIAFEGQSATADQINLGLVNLWRGGSRFPGFRLLIQVHDSILFEYDPVCEAEIIPWAMEALTVTTILARGREYRVPVEAKVGWNWGDVGYERCPNGETKVTNPRGLTKWKGHDPRT
jgi:DNA polymerase I-like protein with 3'-5' exonuclease and polymerase domains